MSKPLDMKKVSHTLNIVALLAFILIYTTDAFAQRGRNRGGRHYPIPQQSQVLVLKAHFYNKIVHGPALLPVRQLIKSQNPRAIQQGKMLKAVVVKASKLNYYGRGAIQLIINGQPQGRPVQLGQFQDKIVLPVYGQGILGSQIQSVKLKVLGTVEVKMIGMRLQAQYHHRPLPRQPRGRRGEVRY